MPDYYKCLAATSATSGGASDCNDCLGALTDKPAKARQCFGCVVALQKSPGALYCSNCYQHSKDPAKCQSCLVTASDSSAYECAS